jgi:sterol 14-demethylase
MAIDSLGFGFGLDVLPLWVILAAVVPTIISVIGGLVIYLIPRMKRNRSSNSPLPPMVQSSVPIPLLGPCIEFGKSPVKMVRRCYDKYGPVFTVPMMHKRLTFLVGPEAQEPFFTHGDDVLSQQEVYGFMKPVFGPGVVYDADRKKRQVQFQSMAHGLRMSRLKGYVAKVERETRLFLKESWGDGSGEVDLLEALSELTILTASRCLHGDDVRENLYREVSKLFHDLDQGVTPLTVFFPHAPTKAHAKRDAARTEMVELFGKVIQARRDNPGVGGDGTDILKIFMEMTYKDGTKISNDEITGLLIALLFAGQHTSCITSTWTTLFIANNPDIMKRVIQEQEDLLKGGEETNKTNGTATHTATALDYDKVNEMELLHNCMRESLRLCPPLILLMRYAQKDFQVKANNGTTTYTVPKGDMVLVSPSVAMRIEETFKDAETFDPDRYCPGREEHKQPFAYLGFGGGIHSCMGQNFAFMQVKTILSILFREYEIELVSDEFPDIDYEAMVVGPKGDCRVRYKKRVVLAQ